MDQSPLSEGVSSGYAPVHSQPSTESATQETDTISAELSRLSHTIDRLSQDIASIKRHFGIH